MAGPDSLAAAARALGSAPITEARAAGLLFAHFSRTLVRGRTYLANHSLGRAPDQAFADVREAMDLWAAKLGGAWEDWLAEVERWRASTARLVGARPDCIVPKTSAGQGLRAVLNAHDAKLRVVATRGEFDSLDFILKAYRQRGRIALEYVEPDAGGFFHPDAIVQALRRGADLLVLSHVFYMSGQKLDPEELAQIVGEAKRAGARVLLDVYHSAGAVPVDLAALDVDFAVGGSYKYLRGGPGCCWLYLHPRVLDSGLRTLDTGWFAQEEPFGYARSEHPRYARGGDAWLESTPPVLPFYQARAGLELVLGTGVERLREYSLAQKAYLASALRERGVGVHGEGEAFGAFLVVPAAAPAATAGALAGQGIDCDARAAGVRLCPDVLNTRAELDRTAEALAQCLS